MSASTPGALTASSPGQTDRVAEALAKANALAQQSEPTSDEPIDPPELAVPSTVLVAASAPEPLDGDEVLAPMGRDDAERLDERLRLIAQSAREDMEKVGKLLEVAKAGRVHEVLGYPSWTAYVADVLGGTLHLSGEARQAMAALMSSEGMSLRGIGATMGVSKDTVSRDLAQVSHDATPPGAASETVTGLDGKTHPRHRPEPRLPRPPVPSSRGNYTSDLTPVRRALRGVPDHVAQFDRFADDERFCEWLVENDSRVADVRREIAKAIEQLQRMGDRIQQIIDGESDMGATP